ncbi:MAG: acetate kinase, partial [Proteobacteria bacterium]
MNILVLNNGSSSLKFQLVSLDEKSEKIMAAGVIERIGGEALLTLTIEGLQSKHTAALRDTTQALNFAVKALTQHQDKIPGFKGLADIHAVGHRVVHGGERFKNSVLIDDEILRALEDCIELAPLHNPANIQGITSIADILGSSIPQVAV